MDGIAALAGLNENPDSTFEYDLAACVAELVPIVRKMVLGGRSTNAVIAALARITLDTVVSSETTIHS